VDRDIFLLFDGDKLDPDSSLGDYDIDNLDLVDVQVLQGRLSDLDIHQI
jgi:hypothetical protein